ncbi:MAG: protein kinase [Gemmatimonadetes bacterium]|nr:protein kinase [Gemmatimonadota bacterium]MBI3504353.1 protein kinase [Pseudomonadota bacterium]
MTNPLRDQLQATLSGSYRIERELGGGGMSRVFVAEEERLKRLVVVKVLSPELAQGISVDRFEREIQTAAALQQANIVPVLSTGDTDGLPYYTMPFVEGESLRARLGRGPLGFNEVVSVLRDVARALAYAHQRGVVHRDIKPDNVLISGGAAVVTDFGIAKAISASRTGPANATLTQIGTSIGTPAYMAPEQAAGDPDVDHRADIYSLGCMAYELLTGQVVYAGRTAPRMLAAHMGEAPKPVTELRPDTPVALADLVMQCLEKDPARRPQSATDIVHALETTSGGSLQAMPPILLGGPGMFKKALAIYAAAFVIVAVLAKAAIVGIGLPDWVFPGSLIVMALGLPVVLWTGYVQRVTRRALAATPTYTPGGSPSMGAQGTMATIALKASPHLSWYRTARGGAYALGAFVAVIGAFMGMRALGIGPAGSLIASGKMTAREKVILAEFKSPASDTTLGPTVTEAFRTDLAQSTSLSVMPSSAVRATLQLMQRPANVRVDYAVAREIATREGIKAVIDGAVVSLGGSYVLSARLVSAQSGEELATFRETADAAKDIIPAISRLSKSVRAKVGESLRTVQNARTLDRVTTPSLEALQRYVAAMRAVEEDGDFAKFQELMTQAIALDTGFAMAYRKLAIELQNRGLQQARAESLMQKAYDHADRLSEAERYITLGSYWASGPKPDEEKSIAAYEALLEIDPDNVTALNNLVSSYTARGDFAKSLQMAQRALDLQPTTSSTFYTNVVGSSLELGNVAKAESTIALMAKNLPRNPDIVTLRWRVLGEKRQFDAANALEDSLAAARPDDPVTQRNTALARAMFQEVTGRIDQAERSRAAGRALNLKLGNPQAAVNVVLDTAELISWYRGRNTATLQMLDRVVASTPYAALRPAFRPYGRLIGMYANVGRPDKARTLLQEYQKAPVSQTPQGALNGHYFLGEILRAEKKYGEAVKEFRASIDRSCALCQHSDIGYTFDVAEQPDSAIAAYTQFLGAHGMPPFQYASWLPLIEKRLGELYDAKGKTTEAVAHYSAFIELWKNADPDLQPQVQKARDRVKAMQRRTG